VSTLGNEDQDAGIYEIVFDASALKSGVFFFQLTAGSFIQSKKMILMNNIIWQHLIDGFYYIKNNNNHS